MRIAAENITDECLNLLDENWELLGPAPATIMRVARRYRWQILLKFPEITRPNLPNLNQYILMEIVGRYVQDETVFALLWGYLRRYVSDGGNFSDITQGISLGCPLSPLIGALFLKPLDDRMAPLLGGAAFRCMFLRFPNCQR